MSAPYDPTHADVCVTNGYDIHDYLNDIADWDDADFEDAGYQPVSDNDLIAED